MSRSRTLFDALILTALLGVILFLLLADFGSSKSLIVDEILNLGHVPLFGVFSLVILWIMNGKQWPVSERRYYALSFAAAVGLGIGSEFLQALTPDRDFEFLDMLRDASGSLSFLLFAYPLGSGRFFSRSKALAAAIMLIATLPLQGALLHTWRIHQEFPLITSFEHSLGMRGWKCSDAAGSLSDAHATHGSKTLKARFDPGMYPGMELVHLMGDWRGYDAFTFDVFLEGDSPLAVSVRISDAKHNYMFKDRFNRRFILAPGGNRIVIPLADVRKAPATRTMDMAKIADVRVFATGLAEQRTLYFDNFRLEKRGLP